MLEQIQFVLENNCRLEPDQPVLAGISGGPDSLCLLDVLYQLGYPLVVAHLDHQLRPGSAEEADRIRQMAQLPGVRCVFGRENVSRFAEENRQSLEEAARNLRYRFLFELAAQHQAQAVAVGHTADDQVETILMHFLRGSGLSGLRGMEYHTLPNAWSMEIPLIRPLLGTWREQVLEHLAQRDLHPIIDESNQDRRFYRNRLRHDLVPFLEDLNPGVRSRIWQTSNILAEDNRVLEEIVEQAYQEIRLESGVGYITLDGEALRSQPLAIQRRLLRKTISGLRSGLRDIDFLTIERAIRYISKGTRTHQTDLAAGLRIESEGSLIRLVEWEAKIPTGDLPQLEPGSVFQLQPPCRISLSDLWSLRTEVSYPEVEPHTTGLDNTDPWQAWLDLDQVQLPLILRCRLAGERFHPLGMGGHSLKLSDYMINQHFPARARPGWPLVVSAGRIAWVPGGTVSQHFAVQPGTTRLLHLTIIKERRVDGSDPAPF